MTDLFGDFETDDAIDNEPAAPEQVAYRIHRYVRYLDQLAGHDPGEFFDLTNDEQDDALTVAEAVVQWVHTHQPTFRAMLARVIHDARGELDELPDYDELDDNERALAEALGRAVAAWLIREGAWR